MNTYNIKKLKSNLDLFNKISFFFTNYAINILVGIAMKMINILLIHTQEDV